MEGRVLFRPTFQADLLPLRRSWWSPLKWLGDILAGSVPLARLVIEFQPPSEANL
jgi:hypothetical protein